MQEFIESLHKGEFRLPVCNSCKSTAWPPSYYCPQCLSTTSLQSVDTNGTVVFFSESYLEGMEGGYGLIEMSGIRLIGSFNTSCELKKGLEVKMARCGVKPDGTPYYFFEPTEGRH